MKLAVAWLPHITLEIARFIDDVRLVCMHDSKCLPSKRTHEIDKTLSTERKCDPKYSKNDVHNMQTWDRKKGQFKHFSLKSPRKMITVHRRHPHFCRKMFDVSKAPYLLKREDDFKFGCSLSLSAEVNFKIPMAKNIIIWRPGRLLWSHFLFMHRRCPSIMNVVWIRTSIMRRHAMHIWRMDVFW